MKHGGDRKSNQAANLPLEISQPEAAKMFNVSERTIRHAQIYALRAERKMGGAAQGHIFLFDGRIFWLSGEKFVP